MPSCRRIQAESPRMGIIKSSKNIDEFKPKEQKHIKLDVIVSKKTISIDDRNDSVSLDNNENVTQKGEQIFTVKSINEPQKKGCLKNGDGTGLSLKKICIADEGEIGSCKSIRSAKSIKFNKKANVYVYKREGQTKEARQKRYQNLKKAREENLTPVGTSEDDQCCVIF